jgi:hypothetical protein
MHMTDATTTRDLNDRFRQTLVGGRVMLTRGIVGRDDTQTILDRVRTFDDFSEGNDPYGEHDFGAFDQAGEKIFWKIDYYDADMTAGSPDPADAAVTTRVLTVMLAEEY